jgi:hypothetical protein
MKSHIHAVGMKQGRHIRAFEAVYSEIVDFKLELPDIQVKRTHFDPRPGTLLYAAHDFPADPPLGEPRLQNYGHEQGGERNEDQRRCHQPFESNAHG